MLQPASQVPPVPMAAAAGSGQPDSAETPQDSSSSQPAAAALVEYQASVFTGDVIGAGTDGDVFIALKGDKGALGERELAGSSTGGNQFERGKQDVFRFKVRLAISCAAGSCVGRRPSRMEYEPVRPWTLTSNVCAASWPHQPGEKVLPCWQQL